MRRLAILLGSMAPSRVISGFNACSGLEELLHSKSICDEFGLSLDPSSQGIVELIPNALQL